ncbi:MAG: hypothetical protein SGILL_005740, partial [Bacillariaceae sp.]
LSASFTLIHNGIPSHKIKILEAKDRIGGRVSKEVDFFPEFPVENGPNFVLNPSWINQIVGDDYKLSLVSADGSPDTPQFISEGKAPIFFNSSYWDFFNDYIAPKDPEVVQLGCTVTLVDYRTANGENGKVKVQCANGETFVADHVIVTVSLAILQDNDIRFRPPAAVDQIAKSHPCKMFDGIKFIMEFNTNFFPYARCPPLGPCLDFQGENLYFDYTSASPPLANGNSVMGGYIVGDLATPYVHLEDEAILDVILEKLEVEYSGLARSSFVRGHIKNWSKDPFVKGAHSSCAYGRYHKHLRGALSIRDKIWIAGEAFPPSKWYGWVDSGAFSGDDAAKQILLSSEGTSVSTALFWRRVYEALSIDKRWQWKRGPFSPEN